MVTRVLPALVAIGVVVAGIVLWRAFRVRRAQWIVVGLSAYGALAFAHATVTGLSLAGALAGRGLFAPLPWVLQSGFVGAFVVLPIGWTVSVVRAGIPQLREESPRRSIYQAAALTACVGMVLSSIPYERTNSASASSGGAQSAAVRVRNLENSLRAIEDGERNSPRDRWDPDYVARMVGRDWRRLFAWVRENTFWIPYHGVLRGPVGVLMDRQGNSLDRAILLSILLQKAGYTVRLARGQLTREQALNLLPKLEAARAAALIPRTHGEAEEPDGRSARARHEKGSAPDNDGSQSHRQVFSRVASELRSRVAEQTDRLLKLISRPSSSELWDRSFGAALAALSDHWWVQARSGPSWLDFDLFTGGPGAAAVAARETYLIKDLPADLHHTITIRVVAEQWAHGRLSEHKTLEQLLRPSDLIGHSVTLQFWPSEWIQTDTPDSRHTRAGAQTQEMWDAVLAVDDSVLAPGILLANGDDPDAPVKGDKMGGLAGAFAGTMGLNQENEDRHLSAAWIEYSIRVPGEKARTIRRTVFDLLGPAARATPNPKLTLDEAKRLTRSLALTMKTEILPTVCGLSPQFVAAVLAHNLLADRDLLALLTKGDPSADPPDVEKLFSRSEPPLSTLYGLALARTELSQKGKVFIDRPNIFTRHLYAAPAGDAIALLDATDIVANEVGIGLSVQDPFAVRLAQGALDTNAESLLQLGQNLSVSAGDGFAASRSWTALAPGDARSLTKVNLPEDVRSQIGSDLNASYAVVAPENSVSLAQGEFAGWWRIDTATGDLLGMGANGWGGTLPVLLLALGQPVNERATEESPKVRIAPIWKARIKTFAVALAFSFAWCVAPLVQKHGDRYLNDPGYEWAIEGTETKKLHHNLGIWQGAIKPLAADSVHECVADSVVIAGITAWLLPVGAAGEGRYEGQTPKGQSEPNAPKPPPCPDEAISPGAQSVRAPQPAARPAGPRPVGTPTAQEVVDAFRNVQAAEKANLKATSDAIRYQARNRNTPDKSFYDPNEPGPADYDRDVAKKLYRDAELADQAEVKAKEDFVEKYDDYKFWNPDKPSPFQKPGACGGVGDGPITSLDPELYRPGLTDPNGPPTVRDPQFADTQPSLSDPNGPPTVPDPQFDKTQPGSNGASQDRRDNAPGDAAPGPSPQSWDGKACPYCPTAAPTPTDTSPSNLEKIHNTPGDDGAPGVGAALQYLWNSFARGGQGPKK